LSWQLKKLDLGMNNLKILPNQIGFLTNLTTLDVRQNKLTSELLPPELKECKLLTKLYLNSNLLTAIPVEIKGLGLLL